MSNTYHHPVMLNECIDALNINAAGTYVDVTFGGGGHSREILGKLKGGRLVAFDQDEDAMANLPEADNFYFVHHNFKFLKNFLKFQNILPVDGILADLGISGHQIDEPERGFSYRYDAPLDMRMSDKIELSAADVVNSYTQEKLTAVFRNWGELPKASHMAKTIVSVRTSNPVNTTFQLKEVLQPFAPAHKDFRFWSQVFQALRIEVNKEMEALQQFLEQTAEVLKPGGRLVILTYHSLEDRLVKTFVQQGGFDEADRPETDIYGNRHLPFKWVYRKPIEPSEEEIAANPRSRSAKLRVAERN